jgi:hypothetical protein
MTRRIIGLLVSLALGLLVPRAAGPQQQACTICIVSLLRRPSMRMIAQGDAPH